MFKAVINSYIIHGQFASIREYDEMNEEIDNPKNAVNILYKNNEKVLCHLYEK